MTDKKKIMHFFVTQKFRFDLAISFMVFVNFALLSITASDKVQIFFNKLGINFDIYSIIMYIIIVAIIMTWAFGWILDRIFKYQHGLWHVQNIRNPQIMEILKNTNELKEAIKKLEEEKMKK